LRVRFAVVAWKFNKRWNIQPCIASNSADDDAEKESDLTAARVDSIFEMDDQKKLRKKRDVNNIAANFFFVLPVFKLRVGGVRKST